MSNLAPALLCKCRQLGTSSLKKYLQCTLHAYSRQAMGEARALQRLHTRAPLTELAATRQQPRRFRSGSSVQQRGSAKRPRRARSQCVTFAAALAAVCILLSLLPALYRPDGPSQRPPG